MSSSTESDSLSPLLARGEQEFRSRYSRGPEILVAAPGRVNLIGEHVDYNDGLVLPMAVERHVAIAAAIRDERQTPTARFYSSRFNQLVEIDLSHPPSPAERDRECYLKGVVAGWMERGLPIPALDAVIVSDLPVGGGLSSSAALEVATARMLQALGRASITPLDLAKLCQTAEQRFAGVPCGIMDQFSSVFGKADGLMLLDCRDLTCTGIPFADPETTILIVNSNVAHQLASGQYATRRRQCDTALSQLSGLTWRKVTEADLQASRTTLGPVGFRRGRHVVREIERTRNMARAVSDRDWELAGELMNASHRSLRDDFEVSCFELDVLTRAAWQIGPGNGLYGSRMTGAGFGGCTVNLVRTSSATSIAEELVFRYRQETGRTADWFVSRPAAGACVIAV